MAAVQPAIAEGAGAPPPGVEQWLQSFFWLVGGITALVVLYQRIFPRRVPPMEAEFVSRNDLRENCKDRHNALDLALRQISERLETLQEKSDAANLRDEDRMRRIHERIERLTPVVYRIAGHMHIATGDPT